MGKNSIGTTFKENSLKSRSKQIVKKESTRETKPRVEMSFMTSAVCESLKMQVRKIWVSCAYMIRISVQKTEKCVNLETA